MNMSGISRKRTFVASMGAVLSLGLLVAGCGNDGGTAGSTTGVASGNWLRSERAASVASVVALSSVL